MARRRSPATELWAAASTPAHHRSRVHRGRRRLHLAARSRRARRRTGERRRRSRTRLLRSGGNRPTVNYANLVLGYMDPERVIGGDIRLDAGAARAVIAPLTSALDMTVEEAALGIVRIANATMLALCRVMVERRIDGHRCTLLALGGAGPRHAVELARAFSIGRVIVPAHSIRAGRSRRRATPAPGSSPRGRSRVLPWSRKNGRPSWCRGRPSSPTRPDTCTSPPGPRDDRLHNGSPPAGRPRPGWCCSEDGARTGSGPRSTKPTGAGRARDTTATALRWCGSTCRTC